MLTQEQFIPGKYMIRFETEAYFKETGISAFFYPYVEVINLNVPPGVQVKLPGYPRYWFLVDQIIIKISDFNALFQKLYSLRYTRVIYNSPPLHPWGSVPGASFWLFKRLLAPSSG